MANHHEYVIGQFQRLSRKWCDHPSQISADIQASAASGPFVSLLGKKSGVKIRQFTVVQTYCKGNLMAQANFPCWRETSDVVHMDYCLAIFVLNLFSNAFKYVTCHLRINVHNNIFFCIPLNPFVVIGTYPVCFCYLLCRGNELSDKGLKKIRRVLKKSTKLICDGEVMPKTCCGFNYCCWLKGI
jgi:hypothetical protein